MANSYFIIHILHALSLNAIGYLSRGLFYNAFDGKHIFEKFEPGMFASFFHSSS